MIAAAIPDLEEVLDESDRILRWRFLMLLELEFTLEQAELLVAVRDLDWHRAEHLRRRGMSHEQIVDQLT